jgi:hypothetical protein
MPLLSANVIVCESVLIEKTDVASAIRMINALTSSPSSSIVRFKVHTTVSSSPLDFQPHVLLVEMRAPDGQIFVSAPEYKFVFGNKVDNTGPGFFNLTTDFNLELATLSPMVPTTYMISVYLDGQRVAGTPIMLRRG